ncbi:DUF3078 domain-containing protein [Pleomorphovibrio marinus]|uniref:DUF3078 domain-containing protein n=1 Tax=Pleomorphovibrio marinus TaxID=2164132 RepID=UPI000E0A773C|nr:DUF3078 domain-containing protein [Pleomorphovibrio marinus]
MRKFLILFSISLLFATAVYSQVDDLAESVDVLSDEAKKDTTFWLSEFSAGLNFNQAGFSANWKAGGINSVAFGGIIAGKALYRKDRFTWDNEMELLYGIVKNEGERTRKSNDRIFLDSKAGYRLTNKWGTFFSLNFLSQFTDGFEFNPDGTTTLISGFMSPGFLTSSLGFEYRPNDEFSLRMGPFSPRLTFVTDPNIIEGEPSNYGVPEGQTIRTEWLAFQLFATWNKDIAENFNIKTRYMMFANYETLNWERIDHRLDLTITAKITSLINVTLTSINLYDFDQDPGVQYSQALALGILYKIDNKK